MRHLKKFFHLLSRIVPPRFHTLLTMWLCGLKSVGFFMDTIQKITSKDELRASQEFFRKNAGRMEQVLSFLADEKSMDVYRSIIQYRCCRKRRYIDPHMQKWRTIYLDKDLIVPSPSEIFIDCGAYYGETSLFFQDYCVSAGQPAPLCLMFEPDPTNFSRLQKSAKKFSKPPFLFQMGLWHEASQCNFVSAMFFSCRIEPSGQSSIAVDTLDHILETIPEPPAVTYIKIDVEGADMNVLRGARKTILKYHPRIAVAIYHSDEHMLQIPEFLHELYPDYRFYIRHYTCFDADTILYCI